MGILTRPRMNAGQLSAAIITTRRNDCEMGRTMNVVHRCDLSKSVKWRLLRNVDRINPKISLAKKVRKGSRILDVSKLPTGETK
jgi:hypothetical protein